MSPPTRLNILYGWDDAFLKNFAKYKLFRKCEVIGGLMSPPYEFNETERQTEIYLNS